MRVTLSQVCVVSVCLIAMCGLLLACSIANADGPPCRPGTVCHTLSVADGVEVVLDAMVLDHSCSPYLFVRDPWSLDTLPVLASADIQKGYFIEVTGLTATVQGIRVVVASRIRQYVDSHGRPVPMPFKAVAVQSWPYMLDVSLTPVSTNPLPVPSDTEESTSESMMTTEETTSTTVSLDDLIVTAGRGDDLSGNMFYVEDASRARGWKVLYTGEEEIYRNSVVDVEGDESVDATGERCVEATSVTVSNETSEMKPLLMAQKAVAKSFGPNDDVDPNDPEYVSNSGLLVNCWGIVKSVDAANDCLYIGDGSVTDTGDGIVWLKVSWSRQATGGDSPEITPPLEGCRVLVTGLSGSEAQIGDERYRRVLWLRKQDDIAVYDPEDTTSPTVTMTTPPDGQIHLASVQTSVQLAGTAVDTDTGVLSVQVGFTVSESETAPTTWNYANYNSISHAWNYDWQDAETQKIWVRATDFGGQTATTSRDVTVTSVTVIHVKADGSDTNDGSTWALAKQTVQAGLDTAVSGNDVWVAVGTYAENITLGSGIGLYGGFAASENGREQRSWAANKTVLEGVPAGSVVTVPNSTTGAAIDGFAIRNGSGVYISSPVQDSGTYGAGIYCKNASATIANNLISSNYATKKGGGLYAYGSTLTVVGNVFADNSAFYGGALCYMNTSGLLANNTILRNRATFKAGGIYLSGSSATVTNNIVALNESGIYRTSDSSTFSHNDVWSNEPDTITGYWKPDTELDAAPDANGNVIKNPKFVESSGSDWRILWTSGCKNTGSNSVSLPTDYDIGGEPRRNGTIDIGADETTEAQRFTHTITSNPSTAQAGNSIEVTMHVYDIVADEPAEGCRLDIAVEAGEITTVTRAGTVMSLPASTQSTYGITGADGNIVISVVRQDAGIIHVQGSTDQSGNQIVMSTVVSFYAAGTLDWPMFMHDPQHTGMSSVPDASPELLKLAWSASIQTALTGTSFPQYHNQPNARYSGVIEHPYMDSSPVVSGNVVVVGSWVRGSTYTNGGGYVTAFNGETGALLWTAYGNPATGGVASTPCIADGKVYVGGSNGYLYCLNLTTGAQVWAQATYDRSSPAIASKILASPVVHDGIVYIGNEAAKVYAFNATTGALQQGYPVVLPIDDSNRILDRRITTLNKANMTGISSVAIATVDDTAYLLFGCDDGYFYRITLGTGNPEGNLACVDLGDCVESSPVVVNDEVYVGASRWAGTNVFKLSIVPLQKLAWVSAGNGACRATLACAMNGHLFGGDDGSPPKFHKLMTADLTHAVSEYVFGLGHYFNTSAALCGNGLAYVGNDDGTFRALTMTGLGQSAAYYTGTGDEPEYVTSPADSAVRSSPAIAYNVDAAHNRWVYVTSRSGRLLAFRTLR